MIEVGKVFEAAVGNVYGFKQWVFNALLIIFVIIISGCAHHEEGRRYFNNEGSKSHHTSRYIWPTVKQYLRLQVGDELPSDSIPVKPIKVDDLLSKNSKARVYRLGHSSTLINLDNQIILTDPVFSARVSPFKYIGPMRFHKTPININQLPPIKAVVISHDHYDHLDSVTIKKIRERVEHFLVPLGVGRYLRAWGVKPSKISELGWWQTIQIGSLKFVATPAQHYSGRNLFDGNETLWSSWVIEGQQAKLFFSGDTGYFAGFKQIGQRYGPFDLTLIENGAYNQRWSDVHMLPKESIQAHIDLRGKVMLPIHNSTFNLSFHDWYEPMERVLEEASKRNVQLVTPIIGASVSVMKPESSNAWWRKSKRSYEKNRDDESYVYK